ncbi:MAG: NAD(P)-dependent oxidoreductase, partial [Rhodoglobus sp.]
GTENVVRACLALGIRRLVQASSVNAIGMAFSRSPQFDYFPVDTEHPARPEDPYSRSKLHVERLASQTCAEHPDFAVVSLRLHAVMADAAAARHQQTRSGDGWAIKGLWGYCTFESVVNAVELACLVPVSGHEVLLVVEPTTFSPRRSARLAREHYPAVPVRARLWRRRSFFDTSRTELVLGWKASTAR